MKKTVKINDTEYEIVTDYRNAFDEELFKKKITDYFIPYDYIVGDIAYNSLRLKVFMKIVIKK